MSIFAQKPKKDKAKTKTTTETITPQVIKEEPKPEKPAINPPKKVATVEGITEYRLENGLRILLFPDASKQTTTVNITYLVGSKHENYGETGMAHLLEHLVFKGTTKRPSVTEEITAHGAEWNGTTWLDRTNYFETFTASDENLQWALDMEADRMVNSRIAQKDLESEMTVVRNEFEMGENFPQNVLYQQMISAAYQWHNYGKSTIGARSDIENVPIDRLQAFYIMYYQPDNAILTIAGKFEEAKALEWITQYFGVIPKPTRKLPAFYTKDPTQDGERFVNLKRKGDIQLLGLGYKVAPGAHIDFAALNVLTQVLTSEPSGRIYKALVDSKKASYMYGWNLQMREPGIILFFAELLKEKSLTEARDLTLKVIEEVKTKPITAEETERGKNEILKNIDLAFNSSQSIAIELSEWIGMGDWRLMFINRDRIKAVTAADVQKVAEYYLKEDNRTTGYFMPTDKPDRTEIPDMPEIDVLVKDYKGQENLAVGEVFDPSPANIEDRTHRSNLSNGMELALLPKKTRGENVNAQLTLRFGDLNTLKGKGKISEFTAAMLERGTSKHTRQQLKDELDKLKARVFVSGGASQATVYIQTTRPNLATVLKLVGEMLKEANFPADELEKLRIERITQLEQQKNEPDAIAFTEIQRHLSPYGKGDPRYVGTYEEDLAAIKAVKAEDLKKFQQTFYGTSSGQLSIVGDFEEAEVKTLAEELFGKWKSPQKFERLAGTFKDAPVVNQKLECPDKANATWVAGYNFPMNDQDSDYPALVLGNYILGQAGLDSRLAKRIRQQEGISYGVGSWIDVNSLDKTASFMAYAIYAPENLDRLEKAFSEEIEKMLKDGFTADEVAKAKSGFLQERQVGRAQDDAVAGTLNNYLYLNRDYKWVEEFEQKIQALTPAQLLEAVKKHIKPEKMSFVKAGDFKGAESKKKKDGAGAEDKK
jgi:zinc protease